MKLKWNKNSNGYTVLYTTALVVVVATALALTATGLKSRQQANIAMEKKQAILAAVHKTDSVDDQPNKRTYIEVLYKKYIVEQYIVGEGGERKEGDAFAVDMKTQYDIIRQIDAGNLDSAQQATLRATLDLPVYVCRNDDGAYKYILPVYGLGLWGAVWGYVAFDDDMNTIYGATFDHKGETPGLGAEIATPTFSKKFIGKQIFDHGVFTSVHILKGGVSSDDLHAVDAISGGTITSRSVETMLKNNLAKYLPFLSRQSQPEVDSSSSGEQPVVDSSSEQGTMKNEQDKSTDQQQL
ncbi:MAG: NADH:ubiquinone reductase (Na(+)-transporting) subunit C [Prevotellaceae bacterium]|jgi:Na+-transporting NADH:ubiquinone oxidoreductase subunit C|nr:NADH:ubiquinone reductase (Na(+)-transporting) subunit C [Prevotellaceae bacterium]